jgi:hypothetical protein
VMEWDAGGGGEPRPPDPSLRAPAPGESQVASPCTGGKCMLMHVGVKPWSPWCGAAVLQTTEPNQRHVLKWVNMVAPMHELEHGFMRCNWSLS